MNILISKSSQKTLKGLDKPTKKRIREGIEKLPEGDVKKLQGYDADYRLRIGNYRVLYALLDNNTIYINDILPRGQAYKRI